MTFFRKNLGRRGEEIALGYLKSKGYKILGKNLRFGFGEIDILAQDKNAMVLIEVKTKTGEDFGPPIEEIDYFKKKKLWNLARVINQKYPDKNIRIDAVGIKVGKKPKIEHIENAVQF